MYGGTLGPVSNRAGFKFIAEAIDDETDEVIDLSDSTIVFEIRDEKTREQILSATTENGKIEIVESGIFTASFTATEMRTVCAGTYEVGCTIQNSDEEATQFVIGRIPILDGVVS